MLISHYAMKKREYRKNIKELKELKAKVIEFSRKCPIISSLTLCIPISDWNYTFVKQYYRLRKDLRKVDFVKKSEQRKMILPINAWLLGRYVYETLFVIIHLLLFIIYYVKVPMFRGRLSCYMGFFFLSYAILALKVISYSHKIFDSIKTVIETLEEYTKNGKCTKE